MQLTDNIDYLKQAIAQQELKKQQAQQMPVMQQMQDLGGVPAQMQNTAAQDANQQAVMQQAEQNAAQAGQAQAPNFAPMAMAMALQKDKKKEAAAAEAAANRDASQWNQRPAIEFYSKGLDPMKIKSDEDY